MYLYVLVLLAGIVYMGNTYTSRTDITKLNTMKWALIGFANFLFAVMVMMIGLEGIEVDGREMERDGFYGQTAVLLLITCFCALVQSIVFIVWTSKRIGNVESIGGQESLTNGSVKQVDSDYVSVEYDKSVKKLESGTMNPPGYIAA